MTRRGVAKNRSRWTVSGHKKGQSCDRLFSVGFVCKWELFFGLFGGPIKEILEPLSEYLQEHFVYESALLIIGQVVDPACPEKNVMVWTVRGLLEVVN